MLGLYGKRCRNCAIENVVVVRLPDEISKARRGSIGIVIHGTCCRSVAAAVCKER